MKITIEIEHELTNEQVERLQKIVKMRNIYNKNEERNHKSTIEDTFELLMMIGRNHFINDNIKQLEDECMRYLERNNLSIGETEDEKEETRL
ncbi:hypothetical protein [Breznakia pachnodae]|uniref:Phage protein n=1 Tax=Breznakia pachnodae TaxID=265178 RepID=A0ABU0E408_9FIRM|nr:hypothetical protein [Breznakia pachnodae]MDQ0361634.1 hypothetical protein [Breznakia pachnodae]